MTNLRRSLIPSIVLAAVLLGACGDDDDVTVDDPTAEDGPGATDAGEDDGSGGGVTIEGSSFSPDVLEVTAGTEVTFENLDPYAHTVTSAEGSAAEFDSGELPEGETFAQSFDQPGTYPYVCEIHSAMRGEIAVT